MRAESVWRTTRVDRFAFLRNGEQYYPAVAAAVLRARRTVYIAGWDVDSRAVLAGREGDDEALTLGELLRKAAEANPDLRIQVLPWDFSLIFVGERERYLLRNILWGGNERIRYASDDVHPLGASHHQKFVVVDDAVAFLGGMDIAARRWDTEEHEPAEPGRIAPEDEPYGPYHDLQAMLDGEAAACLGEYFRFRWHRATGETLAPPRVPDSSDPWPPEIEADLVDIPIHLSRTQPRFHQEEEARETAHAIIEIIERAQKALYIENQYLSSDMVVHALVRRLREPDGPEIVIVLPLRSGNWFARQSMDMLRAVMMHRLKSADLHGRLRLLYPRAGEGEEDHVYVHAKALIADDDICFIGSANLANRSLGLDTELNLTIEADVLDPDRRKEARRAISRFRAELLGELTGEDPDRVEEVLVQTSSLLAAVDRLGRNGHRLEPLPTEVEDEELLRLLKEQDKLLDPDQPVALDQMLDDFLVQKARHGERPKKSWGLIARGVFLAVIVLAGVLAWRYTPLADWLSLQTLLGWGGALRAHSWAPLGILLVYLFSGLLIVPVTALIVVTALMFDPLLGSLYGLGGAIVSSAGTYWLGRLLGRETVHKIAGGKVKGLSRQIARRGVLAMALVRNLPIAPYHVVNMIAGASHIRFRDYLLGTALGMLPGVLAINLFTDRFILALKNPSWKTVALPVVIGLAFIGFILLLRRRADHGFGPDEGKGERIGNGAENKA